ncbi:hypothetical protein M407DRAFT_213098 [Tulasnella calospora MUT 4182]|uniref:Major facilitator superfamily (MFS) profile domain-containing protein n=1 Tax=Tulasnella calospora MUT 4182 TaxID=1051891 RepID=A0A0C3QEI0_9AGAM|nr:hypothetical protein M407DRAFT_213098 [Tulasnella calospora MUT 4182]
MLSEHQKGSREGSREADTGSLPEKDPTHYDSETHKGSDTEVAKEERGVDVVVGLIAGHGDESEVDLQAAYKLRRKLDRHMLPLLFILYTLQFIDKNSLGSAAILGIIPDNHLTTNQFNNLSTAFYIGYIIFVGPHAWLMQRFPIAKYIAVNIGLWSIFLGLQAACHNYGGLFALRVLLGASEGCITSGIMTIMTMFYTRVESTQRISWTFMCNGVASILAGFMSFGVAHTKATAHPRQWQWYMMITSILSVLVSILYFWKMPDNPATARFLDAQEKVDVVKRIRINQNGIEAKVWKRYQFIEALTDVKTWFFFLFAAVANLQGGLGVVFGLIIKGWGFNTLETTLLGMPVGAAMIISISIGTILLKYFPNSRCVLGIIGFIPGCICCFLLMFLPWKDKAGMLVAFYLLATNGLGFIMILSLVAVVFSGHTKKMTCNAVFLVGYSLGQMLCTQFWKQKYRPRNMVPWIIQLSTYVFDIFMIFIIRWYLVSENKRRDAEKLASGEEYDEFGYIEHTQEDGSVVKLKVPIQFMDITDKENKAFRYPL